MGRLYANLMSDFEHPQILNILRFWFPREVLEKTPRDTEGLLHRECKENEYEENLHES